ncbi:MAG: S-adenosyl-l-methionine hydroxide adenosyltransferase family protein [Bacteroidetes bacterium]|nr:S-adenosyl-l-methionine hydroxide adenosyltransferase family protein [Bacteroidota bacterium]
MKKIFTTGILLLVTAIAAIAQNGIVVFQTDFGTKDGAVSAMKGVASSVDASLKLYDLTHDIPAYNIWEAAYRLDQTVIYWPVGTVFVSVVDPGVGTTRKSVVVKTKSGHYIVTPDNGTLTLIAQSLGIDSIREIDEVNNRRKNSGASYTFHGRDVYAYTAARLAAKKISFEQVGAIVNTPIVSIAFQKASLQENKLKGTIAILDIQYGNIWTNINQDYWKTFQKITHKKNELIVEIYHQQKQVYKGNMPFENTFGAVAVGKPLAYLNSLMNLAVALNQGSFAQQFKVQAGNDWTMTLAWAQ